jgi:hypothetical protein
MKKYDIMDKMLMAALLSFVLESILIPFLYKRTEALTSDIYNSKETMESMQNYCQNYKGKDQVEKRQ